MTDIYVPSVVVKWIRKGEEGVLIAACSIDHFLQKNFIDPTIPSAKFIDWLSTINNKLNDTVADMDPKVGILLDYCVVTKDVVIFIRDPYEPYEYRTPFIFTNEIRGDNSIEKFAENLESAINCELGTHDDVFYREEVKVSIKIS